jgi:hypothetical protein
VDRIHTNSPLNHAKILEGDLIFRVNGEPAESLNSFRQTIDQTQPGSSVTLDIYRQGQVTSHSIPVGKEVFKQSRHIAFGIGVNSKFEIDLWPNPDFSLVALGYAQNSKRTELNATSTRFLQEFKTASDHPNANPHETVSSESWKAWIGPINWGARKILVSQEMPREVP